MSNELASLFAKQILSLIEPIRCVEIEYDHDGNKIEIEARAEDGDSDGKGKRLRRVKMRDDSVRSVYYYDDAQDIVRKDKFSDGGTLTDLEQEKGGEKQGSQLAYKRTKELWRHRLGKDKASEQMVSLHTDALQFELLIGPMPGETETVSDSLVALARETLSIDPKLGSRERTIVFEVHDADTVIITIDKKKPQVFVTGL